MASVTTSTSPVNVLPPVSGGLVYVNATFDGQTYTTSGAFPPAAPDRKLASLRAVGTLVLDFDLVDYLTHLEGWDGSSALRKARMYAEYTDSDKLSTLKEKHLSDIGCVLDDVADCVPGACQPTYVVDSGWGVHVYFWLSEEATANDISIARTVNAELVALVNKTAGYVMADPSVHDTGTRLMRSVGSVNSQSRVKAGIDNDIVVTVLDDSCHVNERWDLIESARYFADNGLLGDKSTSVGGNRVGASTTTTGTAPAPLPVAATVAPSRQLDCLINWLLRDKALKKLHDAAKALPNMSEKDMSLACGLASRHVAPVVIREIVRVVREHPNPHDGTDYYDRTAAAAWQFVHQNTVYDANDNYTMMHPDALVHVSPAISTLSFMSVVAQHDPRLHSMLWVDERTKAIEWEMSDAGMELTERFFGHMGIELPVIRAGRRLFEDNHIQLICRWIENVYHVNCTDKWREAAGFMSSGLDRRNPVRDYLASCEAELTDDDNDELLETWLIRAFNLPDTRLNRVYSRKWIVGGAARGSDPGVFIKSMLVLAGGQSAGKTSMLRILGGGYYDSPHSSNLDSKDAMMSCNYSWLLEMEEMSFMAKSTMETVKKFITTDIDKMRLPYGVGMGTFPRACFYAGTTNRADILNDSTGNDRFWCIQLNDSSVCDFDYVRSIVRKLWGLAYRAWKAARDTGDNNDAVFAINLTREELLSLRESNVEFEKVDAAEDAVLDAFWQVATTRPNALPLRASWAELGRAMQPPERRESFTVMNMSRQDQARMRDILENAGFKQKNDKEGRVSVRNWRAPDSWNDRFEEESAAGNLVKTNLGAPIDMAAAIRARDAARTR